MRKFFYGIIVFLILWISFQHLMKYADYYINNDIYSEKSIDYLKRIGVIKTSDEVIEQKFGYIVRDTILFYLLIKSDNENKEISIDFNIKTKELESINLWGGFYENENFLEIDYCIKKSKEIIKNIIPEIDFKDYNLKTFKDDGKIFISWNKLYKGYDTWNCNYIDVFFTYKDDYGYLEDISFNRKLMNCDIPKKIISRQDAYKKAILFLNQKKDKKYFLDDKSQIRTDFFMNDLNKPIILDSSYWPHKYFFNGQKLLWIFTGYDEKKEYFFIFLDAGTGEIMGGKNI